MEESENLNEILELLAQLDKVSSVQAPPPPHLLQTDYSTTLNQLAQRHSITANKYVTPPQLSKFEMAALLGKRAKQISEGKGLPPQVIIPLFNDQHNVFCDREIDPLEIAKLELKQGVLPLTIKRKLTNGGFEERPLSSLIIKF